MHLRVSLSEAVVVVRGTFDIAVSRFGLMFFEDRTAAFTNIASALRSGGRLAMLAWQDIRKNEWFMTLRESLAAGRDLPMPPAGVPGPMALAEQEDVRALLAGAGFEAVGFTSGTRNPRGGSVRQRRMADLRDQGVSSGAAALVGSGPACVDELDSTYFQSAKRAVAPLVTSTDALA